MQRAAISKVKTHGDIPISGKEEMWKRRGRLVWFGMKYTMEHQHTLTEQRGNIFSHGFDLLWDRIILRLLGSLELVQPYGSFLLSLHLSSFAVCDPVERTYSGLCLCGSDILLPSLNLWFPSNDWAKALGYVLKIVLSHLKLSLGTFFEYNFRPQDAHRLPLPP